MELKDYIKKISNLSIDEKLINNIQRIYKIDRKTSLEFIKKKPSLAKKHIKNSKKIALEVEKLNSNNEWCWAKDMERRNKNRLDSVAIFYRGNYITYQQLFKQRDEFARSFKSLGIQKGDEIPICISNIPELVSMLMALNMIGAKPNIFGADFSEDYIEEIINGCDKKIFIASDDNYEKIEHIVAKTKVEKKLVFSLADSLPNGRDPYADYDDPFYHFENKVPFLRKNDSNILSIDQFISLGKQYNGKIEENVSLDDEFTTTYSSGSTKSGRPKAIIHTNRSYVTMARFHDTDLSKLPAMKDMIGLAHIPPHSNTDLITSISDTLSQGCTIAMEPIYRKEFFGRSLEINQPDYVPATRSFWIYAIKNIRNDRLLKNKNWSYLKMPVAVGEAISINEEKFINRGFRKLKAGKNKLPRPLYPLTISIGGGDCEHGGIFYTIFKSLREKISLSKDDFGLVPFQSVECTALREDGTECDFEELGRLVANSPGNMKKYKNNEEATKNFFIKDAMEKVWGDCKVWGYINKRGNAIMKGRMGNEFHLSDNTLYPTFKVADAILKDTKNILSCEVVNVLDNCGTEIPVAHIEFQPNHKSSIYQILKGTEARIEKFLPKEIADKVIYRIHSGSDSYELTGCGKRSVLALEEERFSNKCFKYDHHNDTLEFITEDYVYEPSKNQIDTSKIKRKVC